MTKKTFVGTLQPDDRSSTDKNAVASRTFGDIGDDYLMQSDHPVGIRFIKRFIDITATLIFFLIFGWLYLILWLGVLLTSGAPAIYSQPRYGRNGELFKFYKFRSMVLDSAAVLDAYLNSNPVARRQWDEFQKLEQDPRITFFGKIIRKTSLDELPQLWNVLKGDMSLVGPRPCLISQKELYGPHWKFYCSVKPGITGLWQVSGRNRLTYNARVTLDVEYVKNLSLGQDLRILVKTFMVVLTGHGSR
jgi:lipopolysaccharide/colanic/teichoic acid biosynthesis glycosyltransferase